MHWLLGLEHVIAGRRCLEVSGVSPWSHGRCRPFSLLFPGSAPQGPEAGSAGRRGFVAYSTERHWRPSGRHPCVSRSSCTWQLLRMSPLENCIASTSIFVLPSYKEPTVDALASTTDEGRVWLRKATVSCLESVTNRGCPNGETRHLSGCHSGVNT